MLSRPQLSIISGLIVLSAVSLVAAQTTPDDTNLPETPYIAEVKGTDVYLRSGAATVFYFCGKVNTPARVKVVGHLHGWSEVIPPEGSFSWISKEFVNIGKLNPNVGIVNENGINVWAGSDYIEPMRSTSQQVKLNKGDIVKLVDPGLQQSDYFKIVPPAGAHLWVSSSLLKYVGPLPRGPLTIAPRPEVKPDIKIEEKPEIEPTIGPKININISSDVEPEIKSDTNEPVGIKTTVTPTPVKTNAGGPMSLSAETEKIKECYQIAEKMRGELEKPVEVQDFTGMLKSLEAIMADEEAGKAQRYAKFQIDRIKGFQLARQASAAVIKQDEALKKLRQQIREKRAAKIAAIPNPGRHIVKGKLKPSLVFTTKAGQKRYKVLNDAGKIVCYAVPAPQAAVINLEKYIDRQVGLKGRMINDKINPVGLVMFTEIEDLTAEPEKPAGN